MSKSYYPMGTVLKIRCSTYWHYGISDGEGGVIHNSKKRLRVQIDSLKDFTEGRDIVVSNITSDKPERAFHYATQHIGRPYNLFNQNCEQFVREAHGLDIECTQFQQCLVTLAGGYIVLKADTPIVKIAGMGMLLGAFFSPSERSPYGRAATGAQVVVKSTMFISHLLRKFNVL
ncbi:lecithin retinol acyltransferase family protein [uncultured Photobacterium sp.]|uniref:lecithin retinol acyltransferase family protein n=1 Tax=uncultured Photobacterium sp. TaxID=173973 RepID=UPI0026278974|nr:lecithin retinol acyltransferase family protein [uncultured Photobacterium sp.]